jgi:hypothetical protein
MGRACSTHGKEHNFIKKIYFWGGTSDAHAQFRVPIYKEWHTSSRLTFISSTSVLVPASHMCILSQVVSSLEFIPPLS